MGDAELARRPVAPGAHIPKLDGYPEEGVVLLFANSRSKSQADERGSSMVELVVAIGVLSVAVIGVLGSMGLGMQLAGGARQRSSGSSVATERLERVHNLPYSDVSLYEQPVYSSDTTNPDHNVTATNQSFMVDANTTEPLVVDTTNGALKHIDDPFTLGVTKFSVYQYVTWVDDPTITGTQDYKRVVVVVTWKYPVQAGTSHSVTQSTFVGDGTVDLPATTAAPTSTPIPTVIPSASPTPTPSSTATPGPTATVDPNCAFAPLPDLGIGHPLCPGGPQPTANPNGPCPNDATGPALTMSVPIAGSGADQGYIRSTTVQVSLNATDTCAPITGQISNDNTSYANTSTLTSGQTSTVAWSIPTGDGTKRIFARALDGNGTSSGVYGADVVLDQTVPTVPGSLRKVSCSFSGSNRNLTLTWNASSDAHLSGYRLYKSVDLAAYAVVAPSTASTSKSDVSRKSSGSVRYLVRAYDKAGNESGDSNVLTFSKNNC